MAGLFRLLKMQYTPPTDPQGVSFAGKVVLLTGATSGLGFEAAIKILNLGVDRLIIGSRSAERGKQTRLELERITKRHNVVKVWELEMNSFRSVKVFTDRVNNELERLDIALLNAGLWNRGYNQSPEGWEESLQVNALSTSMLALLLIPKLRKSATATDPAHLSVVSSQQFVRVKAQSLQTDGPLLPHVNDAANFKGAKQYGISKLLLEFAMKKIAALSRNEDGSHPLIVNTISPGLCVSGLGRQYNSWYEKCIVWVMHRLFARTTEEGSRSLVSATLQGVESQGKCWRSDGYLDESTALTTGSHAEELQEKIWAEIIAVLEAEAPEISIIARGVYQGV
ncbi:Short-chain dehydrogenase/reductase SDR [Penicillium brevicompactum]|uniref:Short-chain dehydrogenase/reductase SDR n=1 Tax=Penicillium brevicompactum TaxID=5074 RepID=UPI00253F9DF8|nr:Short-chain dehydrogenase/reductase SDR [Penicillium brevicompactum]KAJ5336560.1 Short-chain dehydrogenase/reductase SDR [Penicillium brevicompactum]